MTRTYQTRFPKWLRLTLAVLAGLGAAVGCLTYIANGIVVGDLWGLLGREHSVAVAQHRAEIGLLSCVILQFGVAGAIFSFMDGEGYRVARIVWSVVISFVVTVTCATAILLWMRVVH
jgi:hypothetical protein